MVRIESVVEIRTLRFLCAAGTLTTTAARTATSTTASFTTGATTTLHTGTSTTGAATTAKTGAHFFFGQFAILVLVQSLQCRHSIFDFGGGDLAILISVERNENGQEAHHAGTPALASTTTTFSTTFSTTTAGAPALSARTTSTTFSGLAAFTRAPALTAAFAETLCLSVCHHEEAAEREYE